MACALTAITAFRLYFLLSKAMEVGVETAAHSPILDLGHRMIIYGVAAVFVSSFADLLT